MRYDVGIATVVIVILGVVVEVVVSKPVIVLMAKWLCRSWRSSL